MSLGRIAHNHFDASEIWIGRCGGDALDDKVMVALRAVELDLAHRRPGVFETHLRERVVCAKARQRALIEFTAAGNMHAYFSFAERHNNGLRDTFSAEYNALGGYVRRRAGSFNEYPIHRRRPVARRVERIAQRLPAAVFKD